VARGERRFQDIQVLRAVACLIVIFQHISITPLLFGALPGNPTIPGYLGVELFFVISGFVVTRALFNRDANPLAFLIRRFFRLTPAIVIFLLFSLIVFTMIAGLPNDAVPRSLRMTGANEFIRQSIAILGGVLINFHGDALYYFAAMWSLSVEYQFYAAYAGVVGVLALIRVPIPRMKDTLLCLFAILLIACLCLRLSGEMNSILGVSVPQLMNYVVAWRFDFLLLGAVLAFLTERHGALRLPARGTTVLVATAVFLSVLTVGMIAEPPLSSPKPIHDRILMPFAGIGFTALVALASGTGEAPIHRAFHRVLVALGDRSYSMYLFHFPVMALFWWGVVTFVPWLFYIDPFWYGATQAAFTIALTITLADLTYRHVEVPWNLVGSRVSDRAIYLTRRLLAHPDRGRDGVSSTTAREHLVAD
jgi:peptidoglycan/LPS O-acetylase OafA/YrhL